MHSNIWLLHRRHPPLLSSDSHVRPIYKRARSNGPTQAAEYSSCPSHITDLAEADSAVQEHRQRHKSGKPEEHGERIKRDQTPANSGGRKQVAELKRYEDDRNECDERPY